jgi:RNA polymerase sigma-70 factor, ECF subfamily
MKNCLIYIERQVRRGAKFAMMDEIDDDSESLDRLQRGDQEALAELFLRHRGRLGRMVEYRLDDRLNGRVSTSDVLQEAYIDALKRLPHYYHDPDVPFFLWLRWVTLQRLIAVHRQHLGAGIRDVTREIPLGRPEPPGASSARMDDFIGELTSPSHAAQRDETIEQVRQALERLDPIDREILALRHFEELSNREVAAVLGIQSAAATKRYVRALERLKRALAESPGFAEG